MDFRGYLEYFGWSQGELARQIGVTPETVSRWRGDVPKVVLLYLGEKYRHAEYVKGLRLWWEARDL